MSILIGEKRGSIVKYYPIFINSNGNNDFKSQANQIFDLLIGLKYLTYMYDQKFFSVSEHNLTKLTMILDQQEICYKIEDSVEDRIADLKIDESDVQEPATYSKNYTSYALSLHKESNMALTSIKTSTKANGKQSLQNQLSSSSSKLTK